MNRFNQVKEVLDEAVGGSLFGAHGAFWRGVPRDEFVGLTVFGQRVVNVGDGAGSNLVKALRGEAPFGSDLPNPPPGAMFRRMPAGRPPVAEEDIDLVRHWIDDGCPAEEDTPDPAFDMSEGAVVDIAVHLRFWREFDNWAMFNATDSVRGAIDRFFVVAPRWFALAKGQIQEVEWEEAVSEEAPKAALTMLSGLQRETVETHYGKPIAFLTLLDSFERFGAATLPDDPERPQDVQHSMNGAMMWFFWCAFADACLRVEVDASFWLGMMRAILLGLLNDGLFRGRFPVEGFSADDAGRVAMQQHVRSLTDDELPGKMVTRFVNSGL